EQFGMAEFTLSGRYDLAAEMAAHQLHSVTDAEHRHPQFEQFLRNGGSTFVINRAGAARKDDPAWCKGADRGKIHVKGVQFAIDVGFPDPAGDQLGVLGTEVENQDFLAVD